MSLYKRKDRNESASVWWYRYEYNGREYRGSTATSDRTLAEAFEFEHKAATRKKAPQRQRGVGPLSALKDADIKRAIDDGADPTISKRTIETTWAPILFHFGNDFDINHISVSEIDEYVSARRNWKNNQGHIEVLDDGRKQQKVRRVRSQTIVRELQAIKRGFLLAKKRGWVDGLPDFDEWPKLKRDPPDERLRGKLHSLERVREVLAEAKPEVRDQAIVAALLGLRGDGELRRIEWSWIQPPPKKMGVPALCRIPAEAAKTRVERIVAVPATAYAILEARKNTNGPLFKKMPIAQYLRRFAEQRGYDKAVTLRDLRHFFSTTGLAGTGDMRAVQEAMGHTRYTTTELYQHSTLARTVKVGVAVERALKVGTPGPAHRKRQTR